MKNIYVRILRWSCPVIMTCLLLSLSCTGRVSSRSLSVPNSLSGLSAETGTFTKIDLSWTQESGATSFRVAYTEGASAPNNCNSNTVLSGVAATSVTVTDLTANTQYSFRVCSEVGSLISSGLTTSAWTYFGEVVELADPTPGVDDGPDSLASDAEDGFGNSILELDNGNFVVTDQYDDSVAANAGAVHLYNPLGALIGSINGDTAGDTIGSNGVVKLSNDNVVIASQRDDVGGVVNAGSVMLVNGSTFAVIATLSGDTAEDALGERSVTALSNGNFVIASFHDDVGGVVDAGSVRLVNGTTGVEIAVLSGDTADDRLGERYLIALSDGNFVVSSQYDDVGGVVDAGSVRLVNGSTGAEIAVLSGNTASDQLGESNLTELTNGNFVIGSKIDDVGGILNAGSVRLVNGTTGAEIAVLSGNTIDDWLGESSVAALSNGHFVVGSKLDDVGGVVDAGSVRLVNGTTGAEIAVLSGNTLNDYLGINAITALSNGNFVIPSPYDDVGGVVNAGSVRLVNGTTGAEIAVLSGNTVDDYLGANGVIALSNGNFVVASSLDDVGAIVDAGSVRLVDGTTGAEIAVLSGDTASDQLGGRGMTALSNANFVIASPADNVGGIASAGSVRLVNGTTGAEIAVLSGSTLADRLGLGNKSELTNGNLAIGGVHYSLNAIADSGRALLWIIGDY